MFKPSESEEESFRKEISFLREELLKAEKERLNNEKTYSLEEANALMDKIINEPRK